MFDLHLFLKVGAIFVPPFFLVAGAALFALYLGERHQVKRERDRLDRGIA